MENILKSMWSALRKYVRLVLEDSKEDKELLTEPDEVTDDEESPKDEASVVSNIAGVTTPLGTGPSYPQRKKKKTKKQKAVSGDSDWYKA